MSDALKAALDVVCGELAVITDDIETISNAVALELDSTYAPEVRNYDGFIFMHSIIHRHWESAPITYSMTLKCYEKGG